MRRGQKSREEPDVGEEKHHGARPLGLPGLLRFFFFLVAIKKKKKKTLILSREVTKPP